MNPVEFSYKLKGSSEIKTATITEFKFQQVLPIEIFYAYGKEIDPQGYELSEEEINKLIEPFGYVLEKPDAQ